MSRRCTSIVIANNLLWDIFPEDENHLYEFEDIIDRIYGLLRDTEQDGAINALIRKMLKMSRFTRASSDNDEVYYIRKRLITSIEFMNDISLAATPNVKPKRGYLLQVEDGDDIRFVSWTGNALVAS